MGRIFIIIFMLFFTSIACHEKAVDSTKGMAVEGEQSKMIRQIIDAVNEKNAAKYVENFAENVQIFVASDLKVEGRNQLKTNRANHFKNHPNVKSEIQHLVEIDDKVIMHDKVWLDGEENKSQDIVEIFTFENGKITKVEVIQPKNLFQ